METPEKKACGGFNFCFWAKLLVAIPALPIIGAVAASFFHDPTLRAVVFVVAIGVAIWVAVKIDKMPSMQKKFCPVKKQDS